MAPSCMPPLRWVTRPTILLLLVHAAEGVRTRAKFDHGWKYARDIGPVPDAPCAPFAESLKGVQCLGFTQAPAAHDTLTCRAAACASGARMWQLDGGTTGACWLGSTCDQNLTAAGFGGEARGPGPTPPPPPKQCGPPGVLPCSPSYNDGNWTLITVPHDFVVNGSFSQDTNANYGGLRPGTAWYRKTFTVDPSLKEQLVWLTFDGVYRAADIFLNGAFVGHHEEGYTSFPVYLHNASAPLRFGTGADNENVLSVFVDASTHELWCYEGGGIYRHVWLESAGKTSITPWGFAAHTIMNGTVIGTDPTQPQTSTGAVYWPAVDIQNADTKPVNGTATFSLTAPGKKTPAVTLSMPFGVDAGGFVRVQGSATPFGSSTEPVALWNIGTQPPLYNATVTLTSLEGSLLDVVSTKVGFRSALFSPTRGFVLNGAAIKIKGTANHLGFGGVGNAVPDRVAEFQIKTLKDMGSNAFRTAHNPVAPELLDYADEQGMLVWEENRFVTAGVQPMDDTMTSSQQAWTSTLSAHRREHLESLGGVRSRYGYTPPTNGVADPRLLQDAQDMALRDRNHPSIVVWSLCNELGCVADDPNGGTLAVQFKEAVGAADPSRPITGNTVQTPYLSGHLVDNFAKAMDVQSFSYDYFAYDAYHTMVPWKAVGGGEAGSCLLDRGQYKQNNTVHYIGPGDRDAFQCAQTSWETAASLDFVYGNFLWTGFDYRGETAHGWPSISSSFGVIDLAGFPKDTAAYYRTWWRDWTGTACSDTPSLSLSPTDWTAPATVGTNVTVTATTCAASVQLTVNGKSVGARVSVPTYGFFQWQVPFHPGKLSAVAYSADGKQVASTDVVSAERAVGLRLWAEPVGLDNGMSVHADGQDATLLGVALVDSAGTTVPDQDANVTWHVQGPAVVVGTANGDPNDHVPNHSPVRPTFHGLARCIVASSEPGAVGEVTVTATVSGLPTATITLHAV
eukprot:m.26733 g.26733  ORF g.26733 m.26733 type:complete len:962 (+) comp4342_c0_seq1:795-3680(+)